MMRALVALLLLAGVAHADDELRFAEHGFSIRPLKGKSEGTSQQVLTFSLAASDGFAPNVNVQVQPFGGTMEEYLQISRGEFKQLGLTVVQEKREGKAMVLEYTGTMQGKPLHWYARAVQVPGKIFLVTGTAAETQWATVAAQLKACVASLKPLP